MSATPAVEHIRQKLNGLGPTSQDRPTWEDIGILLTALDDLERDVRALLTWGPEAVKQLRARAATGTADRLEECLAPFSGLLAEGVKG